MSANATKPHLQPHPRLKASYAVAAMLPHHANNSMVGRGMIPTPTTMDAMDGRTEAHDDTDAAGDAAAARHQPNTAKGATKP